MMISDNIQRSADGTLHFAGQSVPALAQRYGTPLYLLDEDRVRRNIRLYTGMSDIPDCGGRGNGR